VIEERQKVNREAIALMTRYGGGTAQERATAELERAALRGDDAGSLFWRYVVEDIADRRTIQAAKGYVLGRALRRHERRL
jgi:hypothetical protein